MRGKLSVLLRPSVKAEAVTEHLPEGVCRPGALQACKRCLRTLGLCDSHVREHDSVRARRCLRAKCCRHDGNGKVVGRPQ